MNRPHLEGLLVLDRLVRDRVEEVDRAAMADAAGGGGARRLDHTAYPAHSLAVGRGHRAELVLIDNAIVVDVGAGEIVVEHRHGAVLKHPRDKKKTCRGLRRERGGHAGGMHAQAGERARVIALTSSLSA